MPLTTVCLNLELWNHHHVGYTTHIVRYIWMLKVICNSQKKKRYPRMESYRAIQTSTLALHVK